MTIETLNKRIEGKEKALEKLNKKMERILEAQASGWEKNPYYYGERDLKYTQRDIEDAEKALAKYKADLEKEIEKANSRNIKILVDFLEKWKDDCIAWFKEEREKYRIDLEEYKRRDHEFVEKWNGRIRYNLTREEIKALENEHRDYRKNFQSKWNHVTQFNHGERSWEENLERDLEIEKNRKYDDIVERTNEIVGQITDVSMLRVNPKGNLDGYITGTRGKAKVETIGAGGYNIQCFHFRTLIHEMK